MSSEHDTTNTPTPPPTPPRSHRRFGAGTLVVVAALTATVAVGGSYVVLRPHADGDAQAPGAQAGGSTAAAKPVAHEKWQCPMHPSIVQDHPGECPICGMDLVKVEAGGEEAPPAQGGDVDGLATVSIDPSRQQLIGLKTADATVGAVGGEWRTVGRVAIDETRVKHINLKVPAFVERIFVDFLGKPVRKGEPLFAIYSPELLSAQEEYLLALRTRNSLAAAGGASSDGDALVEAARRKLRLWDIPEATIQRLEKTGKPSKDLVLYSPISGVVTKKDVVEGMKLDAGAMPYEIVDLSEVWVLADVYESELRHVRLGMPATLQLKAYPNRKFTGRVSFIDPLLDPKTRTVKVRLAFPNPTGELKPEMFGDVVLKGRARDGVRIPADAVIDSGTEQIVFVALGQGKFQPRRVEIGENDGQYVEVVSGVNAGDSVVTRANFLVDSESRLRASLAALTSAPAPTPGAEHAEHAGQATPPAPAGAPPEAAANPHAGHGR